ncbi:MAG: MalY/PatB family protein [Ruminococcus sp.]|nr:MalY/PatB family protein [Ruminococcus sp.]
MKYDFDAMHNRRIAGDIKYNCPSDVIPMWVADMDFKVPNEISDALIKEAKHGIFGYKEPDEEYMSLVTQWYKLRFDWEIRPEHIITSPGVMFSIGASINALTEIGDSILICQPVYYPFSKIVTANKRKLVISELTETNGRYQFNFDDIETKIKKHSVKMFLLCSPHNPVGRVWTKDELKKIGNICLANNVTIVSDEIHSDFIYQGNTHTPLASLSDELAEMTVSCTAPSKTFNLAGLQASNAVVSNPVLRKKIDKAIAATGYFELNTMAIASTKAAYKYGGDWLDGLLTYLEKSRQILKEAFPKDSPISLIQPEGTYLAWLDCRKTGLSSGRLYDIFLNNARVWLHKGDTFGQSGNGFMRLNFACPHSVLTEAIDRINYSI